MSFVDYFAWSKFVGLTDWNNEEINMQAKSDSYCKIKKPKLNIRYDDAQEELVSNITWKFTLIFVLIFGTIARLMQWIRLIRSNFIQNESQM